MLCEQVRTLENSASGGVWARWRGEHAPRGAGAGVPLDMTCEDDALNRKKGGSRQGGPPSKTKGDPVRKT